MQNLKTGIVVALLLAVCYGAFKALNAPEPDLPPELAEWVDAGTDFDSLVDDIQVPEQSSIATGERSSVLPTISTPQTDLPPLSSNTNPNSHTLGGQTLTLPLSPGQMAGNPSVGGAVADGPSIKVPANLEVAKLSELSESLVPDSLSPAPLGKPSNETTPVQNVAPPLPNSSTTTSNNFPSIPLPNHTLISTEGQKSLVGTLPLLEEAPKSEAGKSDTTGATAEATESEQTVLEPFAQGRENALKLANEGKLKEALVALTKYYHSPEISRKEYEDLVDILDALAREVIYSPRHLLKPAFTAGATDTLAGIAEQHKVTPELLKSINQLGDTQAITQGQQLKVIEGPFRGEVNTTMGEMTLYLNDMYACRFPIAVGTDYDLKVGKFEVSEKRTDRTYYGVGGKVVKSADPSNPYGGYWIDLGGNCIHGSPEMAATDLKNAGCISLAPIDAADAFIMLTVGSQVEFRK